MTNNYKVAMINDSGLINADFGDSIVDVKSRQNRPDCMGINERLSYVLEIKNPLLTQKLAFRLARWAGKLFVKFEKLNTKEEIKFVKSLVFTLNNVTPYFILCLFKLKKFKIAFYCIFYLILKPSFIINEKIKKIVKKQFKTTSFNFFLSISDEKKYSIAYVILQKK